MVTKPVLYLIGPKDHWKRERQTQPKFFPKHRHRVSGVLIVARMCVCISRALAVIPVHLVHIDTEWPLPRVLSLGDKATGTSVLTNLYNSWKETPVPVNLNQLWLQLGVQANRHGIVFDPTRL